MIKVSAKLPFIDDLNLPFLLMLTVRFAGTVIRLVSLSLYFQFLIVFLLLDPKLYFPLSRLFSFDAPILIGFHFDSFSSSFFFAKTIFLVNFLPLQIFGWSFPFMWSVKSRSIAAFT